MLPVSKGLMIVLFSRSVFITTMTMLFAQHIYRIVYDYGGYTMDITGYVCDISESRILIKNVICTKEWSKIKQLSRVEQS